MERAGRTAASWAPLAAILALAALLRLVAIESQGLWTDEALTITVARQGPLALVLRSTDQTPGLYYLLHKLFLSPEAGLAAQRSISVVAGLAAVGLMYAVARVALGRFGAVVAALLLAVAGPHVDYSQEARAYSLLFATTLTAALGLLLYADRREPARRLGLALVALGNLAAFYTHLTAVFWIVPTTALVVAVALRRREGVGPALCLAAMALGALPGVYRLVTVDTASAFDWLAQASPARFGAGLAETWLPAGLWSGARGAGPPAAGVAACMAGLGAAALVARPRLRSLFRRRPMLAAVIAAYLAVPFAIWAFGAFGPPIFLKRTILFSLAGFVLLVAAVVDRLPRGRAVAAAVAVGLYAAAALAGGLQSPQEDWRGAVAFVQSAARPGDALVVCPRWAYPALRYHARARSPVPVVVADPQGFGLIEENLGGEPAWPDVFNSSYPRWQAAPRRALTLASGAAVWTVEFNCPPALLAALPPGPQIVWREGRRRGAVLVARRLVRAPLTLPVKDLAADFARRPDPGRRWWTR